MDASLIDPLLWGVGMAILGSLVFMVIGLISGTDETSTIAPLTLLVVLLGVPPVGVYSWFIAGAISKHMTHAIPTALMGIPGDTTAVPLLADSAILRQLGVPHIGLRKMVSGGIIGALIAVPVAVGFAELLAPFGGFVKVWAPVIFVVAALIISYTSSGRWGSIFALIPYAFFVQALDKMAVAGAGKHLFISFFLGIAIGPLFADILTVLSPVSRGHLAVDKPREFWLAPEMKSWKGFFPNPLKVLTRRQTKYTVIASIISALTFTFSPVGMTVMVGEAISSRLKGLYQKSSSSLAAMNAVTQATYIAEAVIPLIAFGIPLSPVALGPAAPLFNAPPVFQSQPTVHNLHNLLSMPEFLIFGLVGVVCAAVIAYPFSMNYARRASAWVLRYVSQEAIICMFSGLIVVLSYSEGGFVGVAIAVTLAVFGGVLNRYFGIHTGVQYMVYYASGWLVTKLFGI